MSNRRRLSRAQTSALRLFGPLDGARIPGGCEACAAFQTVKAGAPGVWYLNIHHDSACPVLAAHEATK